MNAILNVTTKILAYADEQATSNPRLRFVDWLRDVSGVPVRDPKSEAHQVPAGQTLTIFDTTRATTLDSTTAFGIALLPTTDATRYRITWTGGTNPTLRTGRSLTPNGIVVTLTVNPNATLSVSAASSLFGSVVAGDQVFLPNTTTGDATSPFSVLNSGYWVVLSKTDVQNIVLVRPPGQDFEGVSEVVTPTANSQLRAYSSSGVQIGDSVDITAGFSQATQLTFDIVAVTDLFVEIQSTLPLPTESGILPGATGMVFYVETKSFLYVEAQAEIIIRLNGDTGNTQRVQSTDPSDLAKPGQYMKRGPVWSLVLFNRGTQPVDVTVIHAEG